MRPTLGMKMGNYYAGGPVTVSHTINGVRVPAWLWRMLYRWMNP